MVAGLLIGVIGNITGFICDARALLLYLPCWYGDDGDHERGGGAGTFAAAEETPEQLGAAISNVVLGGTFGAVLGPVLIGPMGSFANSRWEWMSWPAPILRPLSCSQSRPS